ncbi:MAG: hypothetical protein IJB32_04590 [Clostridia bacterium]|nr:hypothetical protein [Clostridia bacterium]
MEERNINQEDIKVRKLTALKVLSIIFFTATLILLLYGLIDSLSQKGDSANFSLALYFIIFVIIFGAIGNSLALIPAVIGLIYTAIKCKEKPVKNQLVCYIVLSVLPILSEAFFIIFCLIKT